jgi:SAM-dependent methyltransferase
MSAGQPAMPFRRRLRARLAAFMIGAGLGAAALVQADDRTEPAEQAPYIPSPRSIVDQMLELANVGPADYLIDLGSGDGRIVLTAAKAFGARGLGVEILGDLVELATRSADELGIADRVEFVEEDLFEVDLSAASVVTMYLLPDMVNRLRDKLLRELAPDSRVVSHDYPIDGWTVERFIQLELEEKIEVTGVPRTNLYLYRVPARVEGRWTAQLPAGLADEPLELEFTQRVTFVQGHARLGDQTVPLHEATLSGSRLTFTVPNRSARFTGRIDGDTIEGTVEAGEASGPWRAERR